MRQIVGHDAPAVGPAGEDRAFDAGRIHHRLEFVGPGFGILVALGLERLVGIAVAAQVVSHHVEVLGELAGDLLDPRQMALREAVDEDDLGPARIAPVLRRDREPVRRLHPELLKFLLLGHGRRSAGREDERGDGRAGEAAHKRSMRHDDGPPFVYLSAVFVRLERDRNLCGAVLSVHRHGRRRKNERLFARHAAQGVIFSTRREIAFKLGCTSSAAR